MGLVVMCGPLRSSSQILEDEADVPRPPRLIPVRKPDQAGNPQMSGAQVSPATDRPAVSSTVKRLGVQNLEAPVPLSFLSPVWPVSVEISILIFYIPRTDITLKIESMVNILRWAGR
jgi:hypothetical protein